MHWAAWLLIANGAVAFTEFQYRSGDYSSFWQALPWLALPIVVAQWALFEGFRAAPSLMIAGAFFSLVNVAFRVGNVLILGEHMNTWNWLGVACIVASVILLKVR